MLRATLRYFLFLSIQLVTIGSVPLHAKEWQGSLTGRWQVVEVRLNMSASRTTLYQWNDPRLRGRLFVFGPEGIWNNTPESDTCMNTSVEVIDIKPERLIGESMGRNGYPPKMHLITHISVVKFTGVPEACSEIHHSLQALPDSLDSGFAVAFARQEAAEHSDQAHDLIQTR